MHTSQAHLSLWSVFFSLWVHIILVKRTGFLWGLSFWCLNCTPVRHTSFDGIQISICVVSRLRSCVTANFEIWIQSKLVCRTGVQCQFNLRCFSSTFLRNCPRFRHTRFFLPCPSQAYHILSIFFIISLFFITSIFFSVSCQDNINLLFFRVLVKHTMFFDIRARLNPET